MKRREVKEKHEQAILDSFQRYIENKGKSFEVLDRPEPPDAIVLIDKEKVWIEITDVFLSKKLAESITSYVAEDIPHRPISRKNRFVIEPHRSFSTILIDVILKKYTKCSIGSVFRDNGSGILIVGINTPFANASELAIKEKDTVIFAINNYEPRFHTIYFYDPHSQDFSKIFNKVDNQ